MGGLRRGYWRALRPQASSGSLSALGELGAAAVEAAHHRADRHAEQLGGLAVGEPGEVDGGHRLAVGLRQRGDRGVDLAAGQAVVGRAPRRASPARRPPSRRGP